MTQSMLSLEEMTGKVVSYKAEMRATLINTSALFAGLLADMEGWPYIAFDSETTGLSFMHHKIVGMSFAGPGTPSYYIPLRHVVGQNLDPAIVIPAIVAIMTKKPTVTHNGKFDFNFLWQEAQNLGIDMDINLTHDTLMMDRVLYSSIREVHDLKGVVKRVFDVEMIQFEDLCKNGDFSLVAVEEAVLYACGDAYWTCQLFEHLKPIMVAEKLIDIYKLEMRCVKAFAEMDRVGVPVDRTKLAPTIVAAKAELAKLESHIHGLAGHSFNIGSHVELSKVLYTELNIPTPQKQNADGSWSTDAKVLEERSEYEIVDVVLQYRKVDKLLSAFLEKADDVICEDGRLRTSYNQIGARSGRVSTSGGIGRGGSDPSLNMQQMPKAKADGDFNYRILMVPPPDYYWIAADFQQIEYRIMMCMSGETEMMQALASGIDFHIKTASVMLGKPIDQVTKADRGQGKVINFGVSYGMSAWSLGRMLGISAGAADKLMKQYFSKLSRLEKFIEYCKRQALTLGHVRTAFGRKREFADLRNLTDQKLIDARLRSAFNTVVQGTAADINKMAVAAVYEAKKQFGNKILMAMNVHDEISLFIHKSIPLQEAIVIIRKMEQSFPEKGWISFSVDVAHGQSYGNLQKEKVESVPVEDIPVFIKTRVDREFDRIVVIDTGEYADFRALKLALSPAKEAAYRCVLRSGKKVLLLPREFTCNPTDKMLGHIKALKGISNVSVRTKP